MTTQATGTIVDGQIQLDQPLALPNDSRVKVTVETISREAAVKAGNRSNSGSVSDR